MKSLVPAIILWVLFAILCIVPNLTYGCTSTKSDTAVLLELVIASEGEYTSTEQEVIELLEQLVKGE